MYFSPRLPKFNDRVNSDICLNDTEPELKVPDSKVESGGDNPREKRKRRDVTSARPARLRDSAHARSWRNSFHCKLAVNSKRAIFYFIT